MVYCGHVPVRRLSLSGTTERLEVSIVPWYWTDDLARILVSDGVINTQVATKMISSPVAIRRDESSIEDAARGLADDEEIPFAASRRSLGVDLMISSRTHFGI